jgi:hypothetical protein
MYLGGKKPFREKSFSDLAEFQRDLSSDSAAGVIFREDNVHLTLVRSNRSHEATPADRDARI